MRLFFFKTGTPSSYQKDDQQPLLPPLGKNHLGFEFPPLARNCFYSFSHIRPTTLLLIIMSLESLLIYGFPSFCLFLLIYLLKGIGHLSCRLSDMLDFVASLLVEVLTCSSVLIFLLGQALSPPPGSKIPWGGPIGLGI